MFKRICIVFLALSFMVTVPVCAEVKLTAETLNPGGAPHLTTTHLAAVVNRAGIANLQVSEGMVAANSIQNVAEGTTDFANAPLALVLYMKRGLAMYSGLGKEKGSELGENLRLLYPYYPAAFHLIAFQSTGIKSYEDLRGKKVCNGPPRGGALVGARTIIELVTGMKDGKDYTGTQVAWGQMNSVFLDGSVDAILRPGEFPATFVPIYLSAGKLNLISVPKDVWESKKFQGYANSPGHAPVVVDFKDTAYGEGVNLKSEDNKYRSVGVTMGDVVHKRMPNELVQKIVAEFIKSLPEFYKKAPYVKNLGHASVSANTTMCGPIGLKYHPGAVVAWEAAGYKIPECAK